MPKLLALALVALLTAAACGQAPEASSPRAGGDPDDAVVHDAVPGGVPGGRATRVKAHPDAVDARRARIAKTKVVAGGGAVDVYFWGGVEPCYLLQRVTVSYPPDEIAIGVFEGRGPDADKMACAEMAVLKVVRVSLRQPIGERRIADSARIP